MPPSGDQLQLQRQALRRGLWRASLASVVVLLIVVALAVGVAWKAEQFHTEAERAQAASARAESELWNSKLTEARMRRLVGGPGARVQSVALVRELLQQGDLSEAQLLALRREAIAQLALVDIGMSAPWVEQGAGHLFWDETLTRYGRQRADGHIEVVSYPDGEVLKTFSGHTNGPMERVVFSPAGDLVAVRFRDGHVRVWRMEDEELLLSTRGTSDWYSYQYPFFSRDGRTVVIFSPETNRLSGDGMRFHDLIAGQVQTNKLAPTYARFSPDGQYLAAAVNGQVKVLNVTNGAETATLSEPDFTALGVAWHSDGRRLAVSGGPVGRLLIWDIGSNAKPRPLPGHPNHIVQLGFSPDGTMLLSYGWDSIANFWEPLSGRCLLAENRLQIKAFNPVGDRLHAYEDRPRREGVVTLLARTGFRTVASAGKAPMRGVWMHPSGKLVAAAIHHRSQGPNGVRVWGFPGGQELTQLPGDWAQFTPDGSAILTFSADAVSRFEIPAHLSNGGTVIDWKEQVIYRPAKDGNILKATIAAGGKKLVIGGDREAVLLDLAGKSAPAIFKGSAHNGSLSANGQWLAVDAHNEEGRVVNVNTGVEVLRVPRHTQVQYTPDGRYLVFVDAGAVTFYETNTWKLLQKIPLEVGAGTPPGFSFSPDGQMFAVAYNRQDVRLFETASGRQLATLSPPNPVEIIGGAGLAFSPDTRWLLATRFDGEIVAWELPVIRAELAKLGLDWGEGRASVPASLPAAVAGSRGRSPSQVLSAPMAAFLAALLAIGAGTFIFLMQRRMIAGYERIEAVTVEQREKLHTAQDELVHSQKMRALGTLAAGIAHDFNNLLSVIRLSNQLAAEETKPTGAAKENMEAVESAVAQGETIVQSMLGYSRAGTELDREYSVAAALSETVAMLGKKFLSGIVLKLEVAPDLPPVEGVRGRLEQMLLNLVVNAAEAMKGQGTLRLAARMVSSGADCVLKPRPAPNYIEILVTDSGPGIPDKVLPRIFEPFFTTKSASATPGTGLGLSTVYTMAEQDGLGLGVETGAQKGTTFRIVIPVGATNPVLDDRIQRNIGVDV